MHDPALFRAGSGEPLVLLHGFTGTWQHWAPVVGPLSERFEVIAPTLAGHAGGPPFPDGPLTIEAAVDHLEGHLDDIGVGRAHLAGNSMGGALALELARRGRARSVVALSPGGGWDLSSREALRVARFFARQVRITRASNGRLERVMARPRLRRWAMRDVMRNGERLTPAEAVSLARTSLDCSVIDAVLGALRSSHDAIPQRLDEIDVPVLLAWAEHDRILPMRTCSSRFRGEVPGAEFRVLRGVGHVPMWDDPELVVETICEWVERSQQAAQAA
jgi:pimeloyl-ACP methyl ester carboxylesterase